MLGASHEFGLAVAGECRMPTDVPCGKGGFLRGRRRRIDSAGSGRRIDWHSFLARVERHYVAPLVYRNLKSIGDAGIAAKVLDTLRVRSKLTAFKSEQFTAELVRLSQLFESHGIRTLHYKGAVTAQEFYGSVTLRNFNDLDFLVRREDLRAMVRILEEEGLSEFGIVEVDQFNHYVREFKEFLFTRGEVQLEPHWSLAGRRYRFDPDFEGFWDRSRALRIRDTELRAMSMEDSLLVLCLVGAKGRWKRLQMITDIAACAARLTEGDWTKVQRAGGGDRHFAYPPSGLLLASELSGVALPTDLEYRAQTDSVIRRLAREVTLTVMNGRSNHDFCRTPRPSSRNCCFCSGRNIGTVGLTCGTPLRRPTCFIYGEFRCLRSRTRLSAARTASRFRNVSGVACRADRVTADPRLTRG